MVLLENGHFVVTIALCVEYNTIAVIMSILPGIQPFQNIILRQGVELILRLRNCEWSLG